MILIPTAEEEFRRRLLYYFMAGERKTVNGTVPTYEGQLKVWISYLYNIPEDSIPSIIDKYIETHATVDRAVERTGGESGLVHQLFFNEEFFHRLNDKSKQSFTELTIDDVLSVLKRFCRMGTCQACTTSYEDMTVLRSQNGAFVCNRCGGRVVPNFAKLIVIAKMIQKHRDWFGRNLTGTLQRMRGRYV